MTRSIVALNSAIFSNGSTTFSNQELLDRNRRPRSNFGSSLGSWQRKRLCLNGLGDSSAANTLRANSHPANFSGWRRNLDALQVRAEFAFGDAGDFGTNTAQVLGHTANFNLFPAQRLFATNFTFPSHSYAFHKRRLIFPNSPYKNDHDGCFGQGVAGHSNEENRRFQA